MKVTQTYPTGQTVVLIAERRFPNGPISNEPEDVLAFLEYNTEQIRKAAASMPATKERQDLIVERERQMVEVNKLRRQVLEKTRNIIDGTINQLKELDK